MRTAMGFLRILTVLAAAVVSATIDAKTLVIHAGHLIDGVSDRPRDAMSISITDDRITSVEPGFASPPGAEVIDLSQFTVLPGLIDCHVHMLFVQTSQPTLGIVTRTPFDDAYISVAGARRLLEAGFTSARDVGGDTDVILALKRAIASGQIVGPRLYVAGRPLSPTGGHYDFANGLDPEVKNERWQETIVDSPDAVREVVRRLHRKGVDLIKIMPSGGVFSAGDNPNLQLMTDAEIGAAIETAHALGMKVAAHIIGTQAIDHTVALGVDSVEHGSFAEEESFRLMKTHGTYLVPTLLIAESGYRKAVEHPDQLPATTVKKLLEVVPRMRGTLGKAYRAGVKIAFGTDDVVHPLGNNAQEFTLLVKAGMTPMDAIRAATGNAGDLIGASQDIGSIQAGRYADLVAVSGDPLRDITELERVKFVMKAGAVVKNETMANPAR